MLFAQSLWAEQEFHLFWSYIAKGGRPQNNIPLISSIAWQSSILKVKCQGTNRIMSPWSSVVLIFAFPYFFLCKEHMRWPFRVTISSCKLGLIRRGYNSSWTFPEIHKMSIKKERLQFFGSSFKAILWMSPWNLYSGGSEFSSMPSTKLINQSGECMDYWIN